MKRWLKLAIFVVFVAAAAFAAVKYGVALPDPDGDGRFTGEDLRLQAERYGAWAPLGFVLVYAVAPALFVPGWILTVAGVAAFGLAWGYVYIVIGSNLAASLSFWIARGLGREAVGGLLAGRTGMLAMADRFAAENGFRVMLTLRLIPVLPFLGVNYAAGLSAMRWRDYALATLLGMLPGIFAYALLGSSIVDVLASPADAIRKREFWLAMSLFAVLLALPLVLRPLPKTKRDV